MLCLWPSACAWLGFIFDLPFLYDNQGENLWLDSVAYMGGGFSQIKKTSATGSQLSNV